MNKKVANIYVVQESKGKVGGGWTFVDNIKKGAVTKPIFFVDYPNQANIFFIPSATMVTRKYVRELKTQFPSTPIVLRVDNLPPDHRNSGKGWARLRDDYAMSDHIIYQSKWAKNHIHPQLAEQTREGKPNTIVYNGVDHELFTPEGDRFEWAQDHYPIFLFFLSSSDPAKRIEEMVHIYREVWIKNKKALLILAGKGYPKEWLDYNFEFHNGEHYIYLPQVMTDKAEIAKLYRSCDVLIFPAYGNACSNTVLEAMASGMGVLYQAYGGQHELVYPMGVPLDYYNKTVDDLVADSLNKSKREMLRDKVENQYTLEIMTEGYYQVFLKALNE